MPVEEDGKLSISVNWPADLKNKGLLSFFAISGTAGITAMEKDWSVHTRPFGVMSDGNIIDGSLYNKEGILKKADIHFADQMIMASASYEVDLISLVLSEDLPDRPGFMSWTRYPWGDAVYSYSSRVIFSAATPPEVQAGRQNHWDIEFPEKTLELIRKWIAELENERDANTLSKDSN